MGREENLETQTPTGPRDQRRFEKCLKHLSSTSLLPLAGSEQGWTGICRWDQSSSRLGMQVPKMHRAMLQVTEPPLSLASLLPLPQGLHHPQGCSCTHTPWVCSTSSNSARADSWMQHPWHRMGRIKGPAGPPAPQQSASRGEGRATPIAELKAKPPPLQN